MKIVKIILFFVAAVIVVSVAALAIMAVSINPADYRAKLEAIAKQQTGYAFSIGGEIKWALFPALGVDITQVSIGNLEGFGGHLVSVERVSAELNVLPLLRRRIEIGKITLLEPRLMLHTLSDGRSNWRRHSTGGDAAAPATGILGQVPVLSGVSLAGLSITGATIVWHDERTRQHIEADEVNFEIEALAAGEPADFNSRGTVRDRLREFSVYLDIDGTASASLSPRSVELGDFTVKAVFQRDDGAALNAGFNTDATIDLEKDTAVLKQLAVRVGDAQLDADVTIAGLFSPRRSFDVKLRSNVFDLRELAGELGVGLPPVGGDRDFRRVAVSGNLAAVVGEKQASATIRQSEITLDDSLLQVRGDVVWLPALRAQLVGGIDRVDAGRYMPTGPTGLTGDGTGSPAVSGFQIRDLQAEVGVENGKVTIPVIAATMFDGKIQGSVSVDMSQPETPTKWYTRGSAADVSLDQLMENFSDADTPVLHGSGSLSWQLHARGDDRQVLLRSLDGTVDLAVENGRLKNPGLAGKIERVVAFLEKRPPRDPDEALILNRVDAGFHLQQGVAGNRDLKVEMPLLDLQGKGDIDLAASRIDYDLRVGLQSERYKPAGERKYIPIRVSGTLGDPEYSLDLRAAARQEIKDKTGKLLEDRKRDIENIVRDKLAPFLKDIKKLPL